MQEKNISVLEKVLITEYRPWGFFTVLEEKSNYKVKKLVIGPHKKLSLQLHHHREEQWIIVEGTPQLTCGEIYREFQRGECLHIKVGEIHRIENNSLSPVTIIEVQNGEYLGEDDIVRLEDEYFRN